MICKICNAENDPNAKFCIGCGSQLLRESTKVCPNGHIYSSNLSKCPFCPTPDLKMQAGINNIYSTDDTATFSQKGGGDKTKIMGGGGKGIGNKTIIVSADSDSEKVKTGRKLVGWLVSFSRIPEGEDFKIYEGRNLLSSSSGSDILINDPSVSSPHCMILFRNGKLRVKDELSTNGTYVNDKNIDEEELNDGDILKVGKTELKFRSV